ncbi:MAG: type II toxin-antitoxin system VapC family toxin [Chloroflexota bacterium]|nr:type II toxin-antitoxin system VapC family toxin [Chloroflexota bacterium]
MSEMTCYFCDTSAIVKYYVAEPGSQWVWQLIDSGDPVFLVEITVAEVSAALGIVQRVGRISKRHQIQCWERFEKDCVRRYQLLPTHYQVIRAAALLCINHPLKGYDAVQVAAALRLQRTLGTKHPLTFVAGDKIVIAAAQTEGLTVDNTFWHVAE